MLSQIYNTFIHRCNTNNKFISFLVIASGMYFLTLICLIIIDAIGTSHQLETSDGLLYPRQSETREVYSLDGIWNFVASPENDLLAGFKEKWYKQELKKVSNQINFVCLT